MIQAIFLRPRNNVLVVLFFLSLTFLSRECLAQGPKSPEASSFEPVDASDMVNLLTGDLAYVLPILNVPSPEGGFPLALSYHAGIAMEQEASWVGLGWSLNAGAINRSINGYPDDWKNGLKANVIYDIGGEYTGYSFGVSIGLGGNDSGLSIGLYTSYSENKAFGGETSYGFGGGISGSALGFNGRLGTDGVGLSYGNGISVGISQSFKNGQTIVNGGVSFAGTGISLDSQSGFGASINGNPINLSGSNSQSTQTSFNNTSIAGSIPIYGININFGYQKSRYWFFDRTQSDCFGSLYMGNFSQVYNTAVFPGLVVSDSYESIYKADQSSQLGENNFSFVSYDSYSVSGQGIGGNLTPNLYELGALKLKSQKTSSGEDYSHTLYDGGFTKSLDNSNNSIYFYFDNTYASYLRTSISSVSLPTGSLNNLTDISFNGANLDSDTLIDGLVYDNYNSSSKRKTNGSYVEVYTNEEILNDPSLIIEAKNFNRPTNLSLNDFVFDYESGVGAYKITGMDGKTYHYSLPVYQKEQFTRKAEINDNINEKFYEEQSLSPYATHWLLTAITGPDYIDINNNNELDEVDYGYWVEFEYGKWSDDFVWRNPINPNEFFETDDSKSYTVGVKEVYYLDKIKTRTHTALFVKEDRSDSKSIAVDIFDEFDDTAIKSFQIGSDGNYYFNGIYNNANPQSFGLENSPTILYYYFLSTYRQRISASTHKSLRLKKIIVLENSKVPMNLSTINNQEGTPTYQGSIYLGQSGELHHYTSGYIGSYSIFSYPNAYSQGGWNYHGRNLQGEYYQNVMDIQDISILAPNLEQNALNVIEFNYDQTYPLAKNSPNSSAGSHGRLTLDNVEIKGKGGVSITPTYQFSYIGENLNYNYGLMDDWGYYENEPEAWSLNQIITPTGSRIDIQYEEDDYHREALDAFRVFDKGLSFFLDFQGGDKYADIELLIQNDNDPETENIDDFRKYFKAGVDTNMDNFFICRREKYGGHDRETRLSISQRSAQVVSVTQSSVRVLIDGESSFWNWNDQDSDWVVNRTFSHNGVWHSNGNPDGVIMRNDEVNENECASWRPSYNNSDVTFFYRLVSNSSLRDGIGGGIRVSQVSLYDGDQTYMKQYSYDVYDNDSNAYRSSGITSYVPSRYHKQIKYMTEMPSPAVMYSRVGVKNTSTLASSDETTYYYFNTLKPELNIDTGATFSVGGAFTVDILQDDVDNNIVINGENSTLTRKKYDIKSNLSSLGRLEKKEVVNAYGQSLSLVLNNYKNIEDINQGISQETFKVFKYHAANGTVENHVNVSSKTYYPSVLESSTIIQNGHKTTEYYDKHDFNTGQLLESRTVDSKGNTHITRKIPAYFEYPLMGSKVDNPSYSNMLVQNTGEYSYQLNGEVKKETSAKVTTWSNEWVYRNHEGNESSPVVPNEKIWRTKSTYIWESQTDSDGALLNFSPFNYASETQATSWKKSSEITRYDNYSTPLEAMDINGNYVSSRLVDASSKIEVSGNSRYTEMYFCGAEHVETGNLFQGEVLGADFRTDIDAHTGKWSVKNNSPGDEVFQIVASVNPNIQLGDVRPGKYVVSFWTRPINFSDEDDGTRLYVNSAAVTPREVINADCWKLYNYVVDIGSGVSNLDLYATNDVVAGNSFDDFRFYPIYSSISSYVYDQDTDQLVAILDKNNLASKFCYDSAGRLCTTYNEIVEDDIQSGGFRVTSQYTYNYKNFDSSEVACDCQLSICNSDDMDGDGVVNGDDNCPTLYNPDQADLDNDGIGDVCDYDYDNDGINDDSDNCIEIYNPNQEDNDNDGMGDVCDDDDDNDGVLDIDDNCQFTANLDQLDTDSDGIGDVCDYIEPDIDGDGVADIYDTCLNIANAFDNMQGGTVFPDPVNITCDPNTYPPAPDYTGLQGNSLSPEEIDCSSGLPISSNATLYPSNGSTVNPIFSFKIVFNTTGVTPPDDPLDEIDTPFINIIRSYDDVIVKSLTSESCIIQNYGNTIFDFGLISLEENEQYYVEVSNQSFYSSGIIPYCLDTSWSFSTGSVGLSNVQAAQFRNTYNPDFDRGASYAAIGTYGSYNADPEQDLNYYEAHVIGGNRDLAGTDPNIPNPYTDDDYFGRGFLYFNTENIPDNAVITSAKIKFYISESGSSNNTVLILQNGYQQPRVPHTYYGTGIQFSSFDNTIIGQQAITSNISNWTEVEIPITLSSGIINKLGLSKFVLREIHDYQYAQNPIYPTGNYVKTWISNVVGTGNPGWFKYDKLPVLVITYEVQ